ncbi:MAG: UDP-N-acetylmuramoyl-tripeptide--D-alanyl-D-alanine ligase [Phycisphaerae bacterium]|nr:UDP-N-acetylmuramoyl-tripeptide--D-alanyl-D-alanine ligase [Phycisphaerae bacterium]
MNGVAEAFWNEKPLVEAAEGRWAPRPSRPVQGASIDTRDLREGQVFFALKGEHTDGHAHLRHADERGAAVVVVSDRNAARGIEAGVLVVEDVPAALRRLATRYREALAADGARVIGVTGSNGKTTTVRLVYAATRAALRAHAPIKSFNNDLGLPLTLLNAPPGSQMVVCEMGVSRRGDMSRLVDVARPDAAVITSIGRSHLAGLGSLEGVAREKAAIFSLGPGLAVAPVFGEAVEKLVAPFIDRAHDALRYGPSGNVRLTMIKSDTTGVQFTIDDAPFELALPGEHAAMNAAAAVLVARWFGVTDDMIRVGLRAFTPPPMRLQRERIELEAGAIDLINDAYNANPESMLAAIDTLAGTSVANRGRRVAILGDMLELGEDGPALHREIGEALAARADAAGHIDACVLVGPLMGFAAERASKAHASDAISVHRELTDEVAETIAASLRPGDIVLLKASRGVAMERVAEALRRRSSAVGAA